MFSRNGYLEYSKVFGAPDKPISTVIFRAANVRQERSGVHARIGIYEQPGESENQTLLAFSFFNVERHEDRIKLARAAHAELGDTTKSIFNERYFRHEFDLFCAGLWRNFIEPTAAKMIAGDATSHELTFLAKPHIIEAAGTIIFAPPGKGKSYTGMLMAVSIDAGVSTLWPVTQKRAMFINLERSAQSIQRRLGCVNATLGLEHPRPLLILNARGKSLADIKETVLVSVEKHGVELIVVDSISRAGAGDMVGNLAANSTIDILNGLAPAWLGLGHSPRNDPSHVFGSIHYDAGADVIIRLSSEEKENTLGVALNITKANDIGRFPMMVLKYTFDRFGLRNVTASDLKEYPQLRGDQSLSLEDQAHDYLLNEAGYSTAGEIAKVLGKDRSTVSDRLNNDARFVKNKHGREIFFSARAGGG